MTQIKQTARKLIYEFATIAVSRGGQGLFSDLNIYWEMPKHFEAVPAMGPGGQYTGKTYADYLPQSQAFARAMFEVYLEGDGAGRPFFFPQAARPHDRKILCRDRGARRVPGADLRGGGGKREHLFRL